MVVTETVTIAGQEISTESYMNRVKHLDVSTLSKKSPYDVMYDEATHLFETQADQIPEDSVAELAKRLYENPDTLQEFYDAPYNTIRVVTVSDGSGYEGVPSKITIGDFGDDSFTFTADELEPHIDRTLFITK